MSSTVRDLIWIVPRIPWPTRCGASHANAELILGMRELGYSIHLVCFTNEVANQRQSESIQQALGISSLHCYRWPATLRLGWARKIFSFVLSAFRKRVPVTAMPYTSKSVIQFLTKIIDRHPKAIVVWDGLHPMAALDHGMTSSMKDAVNIYRAHNLESALWQDYMNKKMKFFRILLRHQVGRMKIFERFCIQQAALTVFVQKDDEFDLAMQNQPCSKTSVVPISVPCVQDPTHRYVSRWRRIHSEQTQKNGIHLLWLGGLEWWPNREALNWFARYVWVPLSRNRNNVLLTLVGRGTEQLSLFSGATVRSLGFVDDLSPVFSTADLLIAPIQSGSGIRVKALEALSHAVPCLGTSVGVRGIPTVGTFCFDAASDWIKILTHISAQECFMRGVMGARVVHADHSRTSCAVRFEQLISSALRTRSKA